MQSSNLNKLMNQFSDWTITSILHCGHALLTDLYKHVLKFVELFSKDGRTIKTCFLGTAGTTC